MPTPTLHLPKPPHRIALIKPSALGDVIHALPVLSGLRQLYPQAEIAWVVHAAYADLLDGHPHLAEVIRFDRGGLKKGWRRALAALNSLRQQLRRRPFDLAIDLQGLFRSGVMAWLTGAPVRIGLAEAREGADWFVTHRLPELPGTPHAVDRYWRVIEALGGGAWPKRFLLPRRPEAEAWAEQQLVRLPRPLIFINLGTRWETKRWPVRHFVGLARRLAHRHGGSVLLVGGPGEEPLGVEFRREWGAAVTDFIGRTSLPQLVSLFARADLALSNDSGPMHLAAALGRPVVAPFTCTDPRRHGPYGQLQHTACTAVACAASYLKQCPHLSCMTELTPDRLAPLAEGILESWLKRSA